MELAEKLTASTAETLPTRLLPDILDRHENTSPLMVLDVGYGTQETVDFFGQRRCLLHFGGFYEALAKPPKVNVQAPVGQITDKAEERQAFYRAWCERFRDVLNFPAGTHFHLCLFWDFVNYLDDVALDAFADTLQPFISADTFGHSYILLKPEPSVLNRQYGVLDQDQICARPSHHFTLSAHPRPQARVATMLKGFAVSHSVLRRDGLLEASLKASVKVGSH